jgi:hypothetical protein
MSVTEVCIRRSGEIIHTSDDPLIVSKCASELLSSPDLKSDGDPVLAKIANARKQALRIIATAGLIHSRGVTLKESET